MQAAFPEAMVSIDPSPTLFSTSPPHLDHYSAIAVGPGIGTDPVTAEALMQLLAERHAGTPLVLDADALNILAKENHNSEFIIPNSILTPHAREYQRLFGDADPAEMARRHNVIIVKKAHRTHVYSPDGRVYENLTGNAGMATAGSGDVLSGILAAAEAVAPDPLEGAAAAAWINGKAGELAQCRSGSVSMTAGDTAECVREIIQHLEC